MQVRAFLFFVMTAAAATLCARTLCAQPLSGKPGAPFVQKLSIGQAIRLAIHSNLSVLLAQEKKEEANGRARETEAPLLPNLSFATAQSNNTANILAQGLAFHALPIPAVVGPFGTFDARVYLTQSLYNLTAQERHEAGLSDLQTAGWQADLAQEQIAQAAADAYLALLADERAETAAKADLALAGALLNLAENQHAAGTANGLDLARARTHRAEEELAVSQAETAVVQARLRLKRVLGIPLDAPIELTESLSFHPVAEANKANFELNIEKTIALGLANRMEVKAAQSDLSSAEESLNAAKAENDPTIGLSANYGFSGNSPWQNVFATRSIGARLDLPLFNGGLAQAHIKEAESRKRQAELALSDAETQVEEDVRISLETLESAETEVASAESSLSLAEKELEDARLRFSAGVGDNIAVIQAETSLERARSGEIAALSNYQGARVNLAAAIGRAREFQFSAEGMIP